MSEYEEPNKRWPAKKAQYGCLKSPENTYVYETCGLGEPFEINEGPPIGIGCELFVESRDEKDIPFMLAILREVSEGIITNQDILGLVKKWKYVPLDLEQREVPYPDGFREYQQKVVGVVLGAPVPSYRREFLTKVNEADREIPRIPVKILTRTQLLKIRAGGAPRCKRLMSELVKSGEYHFSAVAKSE